MSLKRTYKVSLLKRLNKTIIEVWTKPTEY